jgi:phosphopantothenoylcysteine decarboxylase/phosphopantothenate--cysteine ligase
VSVVAANVALPDPAGARMLRAGTAEQLHEAMLGAAPDADVIVMAAAVADFRPRDARQHKIKKDGGDPDPVVLARNSDILTELVRSRRTGQIVVGFAAETGDAEGDVVAHGRAKLARKGCDLLVVNAVGDGRAFEVGTNEAVILAADGTSVEVTHGPKARLAAAILDAVSARLGERAG